MKNNPFSRLTPFELVLWIISVIVSAVSGLLSGEGGVLNAISSVIGVTALIFVAKGHVLGQLLTVIFALFYGVISVGFKYYGEAITYLCMTAPMAIAAVISWLRHPSDDSDEVEVNRLTKKQIAAVAALAAITTALFYFILKALGNANLLFSTLSVTTSFIASALTFLRSPYYAVGYAANDIVLIVLWSLATAENMSYLPMTVCFVMFFINDMYGFYNWRRMEKRQSQVRDMAGN